MELFGLNLCNNWLKQQLFQERDIGIVFNDSLLKV